MSNVIANYRRTEYRRINSSPSSIKRLYTHKNIYYGSYIESSAYNKVQVTFNSSRVSFTKARVGSKKSFSLYRAKDRVFKLIESNVYRFGNYKPIFFTLTTEDQLSEYKQSNRKVKAFVRRLNLHTKIKLKYIIVPEKHKSGAIHYHGVFFNFPFVDIKYMHSYLWGYGSVDLQIARGVNSVSAYCAKYITEDFNVNTPLHTKTYFTSRGLFQPQTDFTASPPTGTLYELDTYIGINLIKRKYATEVRILKSHRRYFAKIRKAIQYGRTIERNPDIRTIWKSKQSKLRRLQRGRPDLP